MSGPDTVAGVGSGDGVPAPEDQPARTALAWSRTALGAAAVAVLLSRAAWVQGTAPALAMTPIVLAATVIALGSQRRRVLRRGVPPALPRPTGVAMAVAVWLIAALALATVLDIAPG